PTALQLEFVEQQRGDSEPGPVRMLVTAGHLRIDDGNGADGYILFDRGTRTLYSVSVEDATVIVIEPVAADPEPPLPLLLEERRVEQLEAPTIGGRQPAQVDFLANGQVCYSAAVVPGLLPEAQAAEREYLEALAGEQRAHVGKLPQQLWDPCDLSRYLFAPVRHLAAGYPVQLWDASGYRRGLVGFEVGAAVDPALFELPAGYEQIRMEERR
ncbi:MAG TPA: hypothetical protein VIX81_01445, partial [Gammaproteobacteria bacterium]